MEISNLLIKPRFPHYYLSFSCWTASFVIHYLNMSLGAHLSNLLNLLYYLLASFGRGPSLLKKVIPFGKASRSHLLKTCHVKSEDSEGTLTGESIIMNKQSLERELQNAIDEENYARAAKIRDSLRNLQEDSKASVLAANAQFYNSFRNGDLVTMQALWSKGDNVCVVHPGVSGISGYDLVMGSWEFVWADYEFPLQIEVKDVQVNVRGDLGYVTCIEMVKTKGKSWGRQFATNVFEKINGQWFMCIHHASYVDL
ncbi:hypothetical protein DCAR_0727569 [Daucus carota subsp. sativus]|uniref:UVR domain-containing protein n=1 Tax=Daucus carota subsp. sativus TaxID=79200 RepID=A0AAF0XJF3_DAUCS|nr:hypothetical protein DCAR_0727569 [Daucus carota subsp. sativus]